MTMDARALLLRGRDALTVLVRDRIPAPWRGTAVQVLVAAAACGFMILAGESLTRGWTAAAAAVVVLGACTLLIIDMRLALLLFAMFLFGYEEFNLTSNEAFYSDTITTIVGVRIFGVALMDFITVFLLAPVIVREWRSAVASGRIRTKPLDAALVPLVLLWVYGIIAGSFHMLTFSTFTWELRDLGYVFVFYLIFSRVFETKRDILYFLVTGGAVFMLKNGVFLWRLLHGGGLEIGTEYTRILLGSDLTLTAFFLCMTVAVQMVYRGMPRTARAGVALLSVYFTIMLLAGLGRLTYLLTLAGVVMIFVLNRRHVHVRTVVTAVAVGTAGAFLFYYTALSEENRRVISYALTSAFSWWDAIQLYGDMSLGTRALEFSNIWQTLSSQGALLWGLGWGAPWREYILHPYDSGSFDLVDQIKGVHAQAHVDAAQWMLKLGLAGTLAFYAVFYRIWRKGVRLYAGQSALRDRIVLLAVLVLLVMIVPNFVYFTRLKFLLGFALAGTGVFMSKESHA